MGKIMVVGQAEHEYSPDICRIDLNFEITRKTASEASNVCTERCEQLLKKLKEELGIDPSSIEQYSDRISRESDYHSNEVYYESRKSMCLYIPTNMRIVNTIRSIIGMGFEDVSFSTNYMVSNEEELNKELLKEAIADSRGRAELLAESMGLKITGVDSADLSGKEDVYDLTEESERGLVRYKMSADGANSFSDQLKPEQIELSSKVKIVWLVE